MFNQPEKENVMRKPVKADNALFTFYDIESLTNAFTLATYTPKQKKIKVFYLFDNPHLSKNFNRLEAIERAVNVNRVLSDNMSFEFFDLSTWEGNYQLLNTFGLSDADSVNNPNSVSSYCPNIPSIALWPRMVCDTDEKYNPFEYHPFFAGYNSYNYDTTMLAIYFHETFEFLSETIANNPFEIPENDPFYADHCTSYWKLIESNFRPTTPSILREHNDNLFTKEFKSFMPSYLTKGKIAGDDGWNSSVNKIRRAMLHSGRFIDISMFNEVQSRIALKRLLGFLGRQILESDRLGSYNARVENLDDVYELIGYNIHDCVGLSQVAAEPTYVSGFDLKKSLLDQYPETIYQKKHDSYEPDINNYTVRQDRLTPDSTSAKFVSKILAPYNKLKDLPVVSFLYPHEDVARELGVEQKNILDDCKDFFFANVTDEKARESFLHIYNYYKSVEGKNFNNSYQYQKDHPDRKDEPVYDLAEIPKLPNTIPYYRRDGSPTTCFATFSVGGVHGAEYNKALFDDKKEDVDAANNVIKAVMSKFPDPLEVRELKKVEVEVDSETHVVEYQKVLTSKSTLKALRERKEALNDLHNKPFDQKAFDEFNEKFAGIGFKKLQEEPEVFINPKRKRKLHNDRSTELDNRYVYTSANRTIHEDYNSYYPNLLSNMRVFYNPELGEDRYAKILSDKNKYSTQLKSGTLSPEEFEMVSMMRSGTKLVSNSASGEADSSFENSSIRMNNAIISMRIIGQLSLWKMNQDQTFAGASIVSTNTDGSYSAELDMQTNNEILREHSRFINVDIEPEPMVLISKDSNNRLEINCDTGEFINGSGRDLACMNGPRPDKALTHPAVLDWALARYLRLIVTGFIPPHRTSRLSLFEPLDKKVARSLFEQARDLPDRTFAAVLFQNIISASNNRVTIPFSSNLCPSGNSDDIVQATALQHYNRVFYVKDTHPECVSLWNAGSWAIAPRTRAKRKRDGDKPRRIDPIAKDILRKNGFSINHADSAGGFTLLSDDEDITIRKISQINPAWPAVIENRDLHLLDDSELEKLLGSLDLDIYVTLLAQTFENNWMNTPAENHIEPDYSEFFDQVVVTDEAVNFTSSSEDH